MNILSIIILIILTFGVIRVLAQKSHTSFLETLGDIFFIDVIADIISSTIDSFD